MNLDDRGIIMENRTAFGTEKISRLLLKLAPPVMLAQLIQALYNIMDSFFVGKYSALGLTALSIIYPIQLLMSRYGCRNKYKYGSKIRC